MFMMDEQTLNYIIFFLGVCGMVLYGINIAFMVISIIGGHFYLFRKPDPKLLIEDMPGVSVIKPLMGIDPLLEFNLESHFTLDYPKFELLFCVQDDQDPAINLYYKMVEKYPKVDTTLFIGGKNGIINPMVHNMAPAYDNAKYDFIWISTSRIKASTVVINDLALRLMKPNVAIVHQLPFTTDQKGLAAGVEKLYFGCVTAKYYLALSLALGLPCMTGMSYIFKKTLLDEVNGLNWYGRYLAEDFFLAQALHEKGHRIVLSAFPAQQNVAGITITGYKDRMVRWVRLRLNMMTFVSGVLEPLVECLPLGAIGSTCFYHFFGINPYYYFACHITVWIITDYIQLRNVQGGPVPLSVPEFLLSWVVREILAHYIFFEAVINPRRVTWGRRTYKLSLGGHTEVLREKSTVQL